MFGLKPPSRLAFRLATRVAELTVNGVVPLPGVRLSAGPVPLFLRARIDPAALPVRWLVEFTLLVLPKLNTAPTPVPAMALVALSVATATTAPRATPLRKVSFIVRASCRQPNRASRTVRAHSHGTRHQAHRQRSRGRPAPL